MNGTELETLATEVNGGDPIGSTLLFQLIGIAKAIVEQRRPWVLLRKTNTAITVSATSQSAWNTPISLTAITDFSRFYDNQKSAPIKLFDGNQTVAQYWLVPFEDRLNHIQSPFTASYDEANQNLYLHGSIPFSGTLHINYIRNSPTITNDDSSTWVFPSWSHALLAFMAVAMNKGGIDFDDIHARMAPDNRAVAQSIMSQLENLDNEKQLTMNRSSDPYNDNQGGFRSGAINI